MGIAKNDGAAFNEALASYPVFGSYEMNWTQVAIGDTFVFQGVAEPVILPPVIVWSTRYISSTDFASKIPYSAAKRSVGDEDPIQRKMYFEIDGKIHPKDVIREKRRIRDLVVQ